MFACVCVCACYNISTWVFWLKWDEMRRKLVGCFWQIFTMVPFDGNFIYFFLLLCFLLFSLSLCTCSFPTFSHSLCAPLFHQLSLFDCLFSLWLFFVNLQNFTRIVLLLTSTHSYTHLCIVYIPQRKTVCFLSRDERERALRLRDQIRSFARFTCDWTSHANEKDSRVNGKMLFFCRCCCLHWHMPSLYVVFHTGHFTYKQCCAHNALRIAWCNVIIRTHTHTNLNSMERQIFANSPRFSTLTWQIGGKGMVFRC